MKKNKRRRRKVTVKRKTKNRNWEITFVDMRVHFASVVFLFVLRYFCISLVIELSSWTFLIISVNNSSCVLSVGLCWRMYNISFQHNLLSLSAESKISTLLNKNFLLGGCVKLKHDSNNFQSRNKILRFS